MLYVKFCLYYLYLHVRQSVTWKYIFYGAPHAILSFDLGRFSARARRVSWELLRSRRKDYSKRKLKKLRRVRFLRDECQEPSSFGCARESRPLGHFFGPSRELQILDLSKKFNFARLLSVFPFFFPSRILYYDEDLLLY